MNDMVPLLKSIKMFDGQMVEVVFNDNVKVKIKGVDEVYQLLDKIVEGKKVIKLLIIGKGTEITKAARLHITEENMKRKDNIIAEAIVVNSIRQRINASIYISFIGRIYPTQFFTDVDKAKKWLKKKVKDLDSGQSVTTC